MTIIQRLPVIAPSGATARFLGDSIRAGGACSTVGVTDASSLLCAEFGLTQQNDAVSGTGSHGATTKAYAQYQPFGPRGNFVNFNAAGHNDGLSFTATKTAAKVGGETRAWLAAIWAETDIAASDPALTKVGTFSTSATDYGDKASARLSGTPMETSVIGDAISFTANADRDFFINCPSGKGSGGRRIGSFDVLVNGSVVDSYDGDGQSDCVVDGNPPLTLHARLISGVRKGDVVEIVNTGGAGPMIIISIGALRPAFDCESAVRCLPPRPNPACINGSGFYALGGGTGSPAGFDAIDAEIEAAVEVFANTGRPARVSRTNAVLTAGTMPGPDYEHPNDTGHYQMYNADRKVLARADQVPVQWTPSLSGLSECTIQQAIGLRDGKRFEFWVRIDPTGVSFSATVLSSTLTLPPGLKVAAPAALAIVSCGSVKPYPTGLINTGDNKVYLPTAVFTDATTFHGSVELA